MAAVVLLTPTLTLATAPQKAPRPWPGARSSKPAHHRRMHTTTPQPPGRSGHRPHKAWAVMLALGAACLLVSAVGAAHVSPATPTAPPASPLVHLQLSPGLIVVSGRVPAVEHAALLKRVRVLYQGLVVHDQLNVGEVTNPNWLSAAFLPDLRGATAADARLSDGTLVLEAQVPTEQMKARLEQSAIPARAAGLEVVLRLHLKPDPLSAPV